MNKLSQINLFPDGGFTGPGTGPLADPSADPASTLDTLLSTIIGVMTAIAFIWFTFQVFIAAISWITSGGDKARLEASKKKLATSLVGLVIVISAIFLIQLVGIIFNLEFLEIPVLFAVLT